MKYLTDAAMGLQTEITRLEDRLKEMRKALATIQGLCQHEYYVQHESSHIVIEKCKICNHERRG